jgi:very-short-patch-repair endonuclease
MQYVTILVILLVALALVLRLEAKRRRLKSGHEVNPPYFGKKPLTDPEIELYGRLREAMPECIVLAQVALSSLVGVKERGDWRMWFNRISQKSVDFVLCLPQDFTVVAVIELDDLSHARSDRQRADTAKDVALRIAGHPIIRFKRHAMPAANEIRAMIAGAKQ